MVTAFRERLISADGEGSVFLLQRVEVVYERFAGILPGSV